MEAGVQVRFVAAGGRSRNALGRWGLWRQPAAKSCWHRMCCTLRGAPAASLRWAEYWAVTGRGTCLFRAMQLPTASSNSLCMQCVAHRSRSNGWLLTSERRLRLCRFDHPAGTGGPQRRAPGLWASTMMGALRAQIRADFQHQNQTSEGSSMPHEYHGLCVQIPPF